MSKIIHKALSYAIRGVLIDVHNNLGPMLPERFYQDAAAFGLAAQGISCQQEKPFAVYYRGTRVGLYYVDLWVEAGKIILELKVAPKILPIHRAQAISYLKVTGADLAIVASYGSRRLLDERLPNFLPDQWVKFKWEAHPLSAADLYPELTQRLFEVLHRVHFELGPGFFHQIYRRATMVELERQEISYEYIKKIPIYYGAHFLGSQESRLLKVENKILLATVAVKEASPAMQAQLQARLKHLDLQLGLLANFNQEALQVIVVRG